MRDAFKTRRQLIAELKALRAQAGVQSSESWFRQAVDDASSPFFVVGRDGRFTAWNRVCEHILAPAAELRTRPYRSFLSLPHGHDLEDLFARVFRGDVIAGVEMLLRTRTGEERVLVADLHPMQADDERVAGCIVATTDVTDRARHEEELILAKEAAEAAARLKSTILNNLSHEIRTPLTAILGFAELLVEEVQDPQREFIQLIQSSGKRLMGTLISVLELARLESGDMRFDIEPLDLYTEAEDIVRMFKSLAEEKGLHLELVGAVGCRADLDRIAFNRIVSNLLSNAIKFTNEGYVRIEIDARGDGVVLCVADTGVGVDAGFMPYLFDEFKQESAGYGRRHEGAGLGLAITKRLVEEMHGTIEVESEKEKGSRFLVRFPASGKQESPTG